MARSFGYSWFLHASMALMVALLWANAGSVEASIFFAEEPLLDVEQLPALGDASSSSSSSTGDRDEQPTDEDRRHDDSDPRYEGFFGQPQPSSHGMGSETSASAGSSGAGSAVLGDLVTLSQAALQASLRPEARAIIPTGPPWYWFRPPRAFQTPHRFV